MSHYIIIGHLDGRDPDWERCVAPSPQAAVESFAKHAYRDEADVEDEQSRDDEVAKIVATWLDGDVEDLGYPQLYIDHVFESESPIAAIPADNFPGGIPWE